MAEIIQEDINIIKHLCHSAAPVTAKMKIEVLDIEENVVGTIMGVVNGTMNVDGEADVRRTSSFTLQPTITENIKLSENDLLWINKDIRIYISLFNRQTDSYKDYCMGTYCYTNTSGTYDATNNQITVNCSDYMVKLDGTKNGQLGSLQIKFPAYEENPETGEVIKYNIIRDSVIAILRDLGRVKNYRIDDIGEYKAIPDYNTEWQRYREENPTWNAIPFDQEFSAGANVLSILTTFRDLYPGYEMFFDADTNEFICQMKPMCYDDEVLLNNKFLQDIIISESSSVEMNTVRNICEVWGQVIETEYYADTSTYSGNVYSCSIPALEEKYYNGDIIAIKVPQSNAEGAQINVNGFGNVTIQNEDDESPIKADMLKANEVYSFKIRKKRIDKQDVIVAYLLGQWQIHAMDVLSNGIITGEKYTTSKGAEVDKYSKEYFQDVYNCDNVSLTIIHDSPFAVEKIGEILDVKTGNEYEHITSVDLAISRAQWENWKNCRLTDNITITTLLLPWLDVNKKIEYRPNNDERAHQYITKSISHDFSAFTTTINMYRFYPYYRDGQHGETGWRHEELETFTHKELERYTHSQLREGR